MRYVGHGLSIVMLTLVCHPFRSLFVVHDDKCVVLETAVMLTKAGS